MRIGFIGAGKVGCTLGKYLKQKLNDMADGEKPTISGYYSRTSEHAKDAATFTDTAQYKKLSELVYESDVLLFTVPDGAIGSVWDDVRELDVKGKLVCHCSGAMTSQIFSGVTEAGAFGYSIHPMYAISSKTKSYLEMDACTVTVEGDPAWRDRICEFIRDLGNPCFLLSAENKTKYHAASVFASNLVAGLFGSAVKLLTECGFGEAEAISALSPLVVGNAMHLATDGPVQGLTGPIERNDAVTVNKHLAALPQTEEEIYRSVSKAVLELAKARHPETDYHEIEQLLADRPFSGSLDFVRTNSRIGEKNDEEHNHNIDANETFRA